jgi:hypothetical protein
MGWGDNIARHGFDEFGRDLGDAIDRGTERLGKGAKRARGLFTRGRAYGPGDTGPGDDGDGLVLWSDSRDCEDEQDRASAVGWNASDAAADRSDRGWGRADDGLTDRGWSRDREDVGGWH